MVGPDARLHHRKYIYFTKLIDSIEESYRSISVYIIRPEIGNIGIYIEKSKINKRACQKIGIEMPAVEIIMLIRSVYLYKLPPRFQRLYLPEAISILRC